MRKRRIQTRLALLLAVVAVSIVGAQAQGAPQAQGPSQARSPRGELTVTLTVVSSVGLVTGPDGVRRLVLANAPDPADNVSRIMVIPSNNPAAAPIPQRPRKKAKQTLPS